MGADNFTRADDDGWWDDDDDYWTFNDGSFLGEAPSDTVQHATEAPTIPISVNIWVLLPPSFPTLTYLPLYRVFLNALRLQIKRRA